MKSRKWTALTTVLMTLTAATFLMAFESPSQGDENFNKAREQLDRRQYEQAISGFDSVIRQGGDKADDAMYWKAYALNRARRPSEALQAIAALRKGYPESSWLREAQALETEIRQGAGQPVDPNQVADEEIKLTILNSMISMDSAKAVPLLLKVLQGNNSPAMKEKALFVLANSGAPEAVGMLRDVAMGKSHPELSRKAIEYLGIFGGKGSGETLRQIYQSNQDTAARRAVLNAFMLAGEKDWILQVAKSETVPELRRCAIEQLGILGADKELTELYASSDPSSKKAILNALFISGAAGELTRLARGESDVELRREAIEKLGLTGDAAARSTLVEIYKQDTDRGAKKAVLNALFLASGDKELIQIVQLEKDRELRKEAVEKLSLIGSPAAIEFLLKLLDQ